MTEEIKEETQVVEVEEVAEAAPKPKTRAKKKSADIPVIVKKGFWVDEKTKIKKGAEDVSIPRELYDTLVKSGAVERNDPLPE